VIFLIEGIWPTILAKLELERENKNEKEKEKNISRLKGK